jgi:rhodanese-related sulfurtransferase
LLPPIKGAAAADSGADSRQTGIEKLMSPRSIDRDEVRRLLAEENAQLVEVLPAQDFTEEHIIGAINIPLKELDERAPRELDRERPVIVYCNDYQ